MIIRYMPLWESDTEAADAVVDFASAKAVDELLDYCLEKELPLVLCTTGLTEEQLKRQRMPAKGFRFFALPICLLV